MQHDFWKGIIDTVSAVNPENVDKEQIKEMLKWDRTHSIEVLDSLYMRHVLTVEEYTECLARYVERLGACLRVAKEQLSDVREKKEKYDPYSHYGFGFISRGPVIDNAINSGF